MSLNEGNKAISRSRYFASPVVISSSAVGRDFLAAESPVVAWHVGVRRKDRRVRLFVLPQLLRRPSIPPPVHGCSRASTRPAAASDCATSYCKPVLRFVNTQRSSSFPERFAAHFIGFQLRDRKHGCR